jgi:ADP-ribose pyrophosphatase YjhB (NUDIX family)
MTVPRLCVGAIAVSDGRLLLIRRGREPAAGKWSVPGGRLEAGETVAAAVARELREETGLEGACGELVGWVERIDPDHHYVILDFRVRVEGSPEPVPGDDAVEAAWVPLGQVPSLSLVSGLEDFLRTHGVLP